MVTPADGGRDVGGPPSDESESAIRDLPGTAQADPVSLTFTGDTLVIVRLHPSVLGLPQDLDGDIVELAGPARPAEPSQIVAAYPSSGRTVTLLALSYPTDEAELRTVAADDEQVLFTGCDASGRRCGPAREAAVRPSILRPNISACSNSEMAPRIWKNMRPTAVDVSMPWLSTTR